MGKKITFMSSVVLSILSISAIIILIILTISLVKTLPMVVTVSCLSFFTVLFWGIYLWKYLGKKTIVINMVYFIYLVIDLGYIWKHFNYMYNFPYYLYSENRSSWILFHKFIDLGFLICIFVGIIVLLISHNKKYYSKIKV